MLHKNNVATNDKLNEHAASINRELSNHRPFYRPRDSNRPIRDRLYPTITTINQSSLRLDKHTYYIGKGYIICLLINLGSCKGGDLHRRTCVMLHGLVSCYMVLCHVNWSYANGTVLNPRRVHRTLLLK